MDREEKILIESLKEGNHHSFSTIYRLYRERIYLFICKFIDDREIA
ncbi:MAG: hypothetical protein WC960_02160 [Bacteroidales bacterium]